MARLIDKDAAYAALKHEEETHWLSFSAEAFGKAARIIDQMPTIEAEPVKRGRWNHRQDMDYVDQNGAEHIHGQCSECGLIHDFIDGHTAQYKYCPQCGAKMDGGV